MHRPVLPLPGLTGGSRRARWRRGVVRRVAAAFLAAGAVVVAVAEVRPPPEPRVTVVVAARAVAAGEVLSPADVRPTRVVAAATQPGALGSVDDAVGRRLVAGLVPEEAVTTSRLVPRGPVDGLPAGRVAVHVVVADPAAVDLFRPGTRARVYPTAGGAPLARDALVLVADPVGGETDPLAGRAPRGVVLSLSPTEADAVVGGHGGLEGPVTVALLALPP